jgi:hypothetical protein
MTSKIFWGSSNCSYSGLLSTQRNFEFLIEDELDNESLDVLWGAVVPMSNVILDQVETPEDSIEEAEQTLIDNVRLDGDEVFFSVDKLHGNRLKGTDGVHVHNLVLVDRGIDAVFSDKHGTILFWFENESGARISNIGYVNRPEKISNRINGESEISSKTDLTKQDQTAFAGIFGYFEFGSVRTAEKVTTSVGIGFWRMPRYARRSSTIRLIDIKGFVTEELNRIREERNDDIEIFDRMPGSAVPSETQLLKYISREIGKLEKNIISIEKGNLFKAVNWQEWVKGLELLVPQLLKDKMLIRSLGTDEARFIFSKIPLISAWIQSNDTQGLLSGDLQKLLCLFVDISTIISIYELNEARRKSPLNKDLINNKIGNCKVLTFVGWIIGKDIDFDTETREYLGLLLNELGELVKYRDLFAEAISEMANDEDLDIAVYRGRDGKVYLYLRDIDSSSMELMTTSGACKTFRKMSPSYFTIESVQHKRLIVDSIFG